MADIPRRVSAFFSRGRSSCFETLYLLDEQDRVVGISGYVVRPARALRERPRVSAFTSANIDKIIALRPDLVLTFSDLQADIAADLIRRGLAGARIMEERSCCTAGIGTKLGNHSFSATAITAYLKNGGTLEKAAAMANHASTRIHALRSPARRAKPRRGERIVI
jgi:iron complex transport system substrate-binding protein